MNPDEKKCPRCAETVKKEALVCRHCGYDFEAAGAAPAKPKRKLGLLGCVGLVILGIGAISVFSTAMPEDPKAKAEREAKDAEEKRKGFHCLSALDGSHRGVVESVRKSLRNPDSFKHDDTRILPVNAKGEHELVMRYRAENGFGGTNVEGVTAVIASADCSVKSVTEIG